MGERRLGGAAEWMLHYPDICPHSSLHLCSLTPNGSLLGKGNVGMRGSWEWGLNHDWQGKSIGSPEKPVQENSSWQAHCISHLGQFSADLIGLSKSLHRKSMESSPDPQAMLMGSQGKEEPDLRGSENRPPGLYCNPITV